MTSPRSPRGGTVLYRQEGTPLRALQILPATPDPPVPAAGRALQGCVDATAACTGPSPLAGTCFPGAPTNPQQCTCMGIGRPGAMVGVHAQGATLDQQGQEQ